MMAFGNPWNFVLATSPADLRALVGTLDRRQRLGRNDVAVHGRRKAYEEEPCQCDIVRAARLGIYEFTNVRIYELTNWRLRSNP